MTSVLTRTVDTSTTQKNKRKKRLSKSERKRRKRQREAEAIKNGNDCFISSNHEKKQDTGNEESSENGTHRVLETCNDDKFVENKVVENKDNVMKDDNQFTLMNENSMLVRNVKFVYPIKEKFSAQGKPISYVHSKLRKYHNGDTSLQGNNAENAITQVDSKQDRQERELNDTSIDDILFPEKKKQKAKPLSDDDQKTNVEDRQPPNILDNEKQVVELKKEVDSNHEKKENNVHTKESSQETNTSELLTNADADSIRRGRTRSDSLSDPAKMCLTGRTVEDAIRDTSGRRPRSNSTDCELKLPIRGLCDERVVLQNNVWDLNVFKRAPPRGFVNLGNTCFLNSTLQCLAYLPTFCQCVAMLPSIRGGGGDGQSSKVKSNTGLQITMILRSLLRKIHGLDGDVKQAQVQKTISPKHIVRSISLLGGNHRGYQFRPGRQEDAHEFLVHLLDAMNDGELKAAGINQKKSGWRDKLPIPRLDETTLTHRMFGGYLRSQVRCTKCKYKSNTYDPFLDLSLEVSSKKIGSLYEALSEYTRKETLDAENKWKCAGCKKHVCATKQLTIFRPPLTLCIQLKRFSFGGGFGGFMHHQGYSHFAGKGMGMVKGGSKVQKLIEFPATLKLPLSDGRKCEYDLSGVIVHIGGSATSGHYTAFVRRTSKNNKVQWLNMDDSFVEPVTEKAVLRNKDAYVLFYCRKEVQLEMSSIPASSNSDSLNCSKDTNKSKTKLDENNSYEVVSEQPKLDNIQHPFLNTYEKSNIDDSKGLAKQPLPPDEGNLSSETIPTLSNNTTIPLNANNQHSKPEKSPNKSLVEDAMESPQPKAYGNDDRDNIVTKNSHTPGLKKKELSLDMGSIGRVKVMLRSLKLRNKAWKPPTKSTDDPTTENGLLGDRAIGCWDDDDDREKEARSASLEKEAKIRAAIFSDTKLQEKSKKRKMYLDSWDRALDAGKVKKVKDKVPCDCDHMTPHENPFHRIQQSMLQMKSGPKGFHKTSKHIRLNKQT
mmetsp:Transcript_1875/g.3387  ORF Transcript_1875/g.3387 Transcript_1875/m.3387 type:complete len:995 (-) Transcript_1875:93-3077(-)